MVDAAVAILSTILIAGALSSWPTFTWAAVLGFDDWKVECPDKPGDTNKETSARAGRCLAAQRLEEEKTGAVVFAFSVVVDDQVPAKRSRPFLGLVSIPLGGYLPPGLELTIDRGRPYRLLFETCNASGCHAGFPLGGAVLKAMRGGREARFRLWTKKSKPAEVGVSLAGFTQALDALAARSEGEGQRP
jgi:invasion protein IalB